MSSGPEGLSEALRAGRSPPPRARLCPVETNCFPALSVHVERGRSKLRVVACSAERDARLGAASRDLLIEATFSGGQDGVWFRLTRAGEARTFSRETVARHPALSAILRLVADEVDLAKGGSLDLLVSLFHGLLVYVGRMPTAVPLPNRREFVRDRRIERAVQLLNENISRRWTVELVARAVGLSRSAFARQFQRVLGLSPMRYLTQRRMRAAAAILLGSDAGLAEVAAQVGYGSEFAFNRAFKRHHRVPPGEFRQRPPTTIRSTLSLAA